MVPLTTLLVTYALTRLAFGRRPDRTLPGRLALATMLVVTGAAHFTATDALVAMVPPSVPAPIAVVYATGVMELVFALLLVVRPRPALGWALGAFFLMLLPANVYSALQEVGLGGHGPGYLWFRIPLQVLFMGWAAYFTGATRVRAIRRAGGSSCAPRPRSPPELRPTRAAGPSLSSWPHAGIGAT